MRLPALILIGFVPVGGYVAAGDNSPATGTDPARAEIERIYAAYVYEKSLCPKIVAEINKNKSLVDRLVRNQDTLKKEVEDIELLRASTAVSNTMIRYLFDHEEYLIVGVDYHGGAGMVHGENSPVFCSQTGKRLEEIEAFGPSEQGFQIRLDVLKYVHPLYIPPFGEWGMQYENPAIRILSFIRIFGEIKSLYTSKHYLERLKGVAQQAVHSLDAEMKLIQHASPRAVAEKVYCHPYGKRIDEHCPTASQIREIERRIREHVDMLDEWISETTSGLPQ